MSTGMLRLLFVVLPKLGPLVVLSLVAVVAFDIAGLRQPLSQAYYDLVGWALQPVLDNFQDLGPSSVPAPPLKTG